MYRAGRIDLSYNKMYCIDLGRTGTGFSAEPYLCSVSGAFCQERPCRPTSNLRGIRTRRIAVASSSDNSYTVFNGDDTAYLEGTRGPRGRELISDELKQVLGLALPALVVVLSDPMQTLVDSACLGRQSTVHLAALGPNTAVFNSVFQLFSFLGVATANTVASNSLQKDGLTLEEKEERRNIAEMTAMTAVMLAVFFGILALFCLVHFGPRWLILMGTDPQVVPYAQEYMVIRSLGTPFVLVMNACQGMCLGQQDTITPMLVCAIATACNILGDLLLIWGLKMGVQGAAIATTAAQVFATFLILWRVKRKGKQPTSIDLRWKGIPDVSTLKMFATVGSTLIARTAVGMAAYFSMTAAATSLGMVAAAAHQVAMQIFWFISFLPEPLSMAAQTLVAKEAGDPKAASGWARLLVASGTGFGVFLALIAAVALLCASPIFTPDIVVQQIVQSLAPYAALAMGICGLMMMFDGISIGSGSFGHLPAGVVAGLVATIGLLWRGSKVNAGIASVWWALCGFYGMRLAGHLMYYGLTWPRNVFSGRNEFGSLASADEEGDIIPRASLAKEQ